MLPKCMCTVQVFLRVCVCGVGGGAPLCLPSLCALDSGVCPPEQIKAPHLRAQRQIQHMELRNICRDRRDGKVQSSIP